MQISIGDYPKNVKQAVRCFWGAKAAAKQKKQDSGRIDQGERGGATAGKNFDGFASLVCSIISESAHCDVSVGTSAKEITLPGFFRATKRWDIVAVNQQKKLLAAIELKSLGGPSYGNNANNRCEEAIGTAVDLRTAQREGKLGSGAAPFLGYLIMVKDDEKSSNPPKSPHNSPYFENDPIFADASYQQKMAILCERLVQEGLYDSAVAIAARDDGGKSGEFSDISSSSSMQKFLLKLASHIATETIQASKN